MEPHTVIKSLIIAAGALAPLAAGAYDYTITTASEWNALARHMANNADDLSGKTVAIANDIDFDGSDILPLGYDHTTLFNGELDGGGHTLSGYTCTADTMMFGALATSTGTSAYIHDITVAGAVNTGNSFTGGAVGFLCGTIDNVAHAGTLTSTGGQIVGGVVGGTDAGAVITNCCNRGTVSTNFHQAGGVVGRAWMSTVRKCWNEGTVTSTNVEAAGVIAVVYSDTTGTCVTDSCYNIGTVITTADASFTAGVASMVWPGQYTNCWNSGTVSGSGGSYVSGVFGLYYGIGQGFCVDMVNCYNTSDISGSEMISGIISYGLNGSYPTVNMTGCYNTGDITASSGRANGIACHYTPGATYTDCYNTGDINAGTATYSSGLFGVYHGATPAEDVTTLFKRCWNSGSVTSSGGSSTAGVVSRVYSYTTVDSCYNTGDISSNSASTAGIVAALYGLKKSRVTNCWNSGDITCTGTNTIGANAGGIVGFNTTIDTIANCFNTGNITATQQKYAGGIAGQMAAAATNVYNTGNVTAPTYAGGIAGYKLASHGTLTSCYNTGTVTATTQSTTLAGAIMCGTGTSLVSEAYCLENSLTGNDYDSVATCLSRAQLATLDMGSSWTAGDNYTYPRLTAADNDCAKAHAAAVIPQGTDTYDNITTWFNVGAPDGVTWSSSPSVNKFYGNNAYFSQTYTGTLYLTATCGQSEVTTTLTCNVEESGVGSTAGDDTRAVVCEKFYTLDGLQVAEPARGIYIVTRTYTDGTTQTVKVAR